MESLYHYTTVDTLKLILKNKTFRFTSLEFVDDLEEAETEDFGNLGRFCYVSCWTENSEESISMWKEYTDPKQGIRIKLPKYIFETEHNIGFSDKQMQQMNMPMLKSRNLYPLEYTKGVAEIEWENKVKFMPQIVKLSPVTYTQDPELLHTSVYSETDSNITLETKLIGKFKSTIWRYQKEWRYHLFTLPLGMFTIAQNTLNGIAVDPATILKSMKEKNIDYKYFDIPFNTDYLNGIEIVMSPQIEEKAQKELKSITQNIVGCKIVSSNQRWR